MSNLNDEDKITEETKSEEEDKKELNAEEKLKNTEDKLLRSLAELENQRNRFEKDIKEAIEFGGFSFARENLAILDNLQRAKEANFDVLALTVDTITGGNRERDLRTGFVNPPKFPCTMQPVSRLKG